jgi:nitrate reductase beta subunit
MNINAIVLIPAKSHSIRLPNKNISKINGKTLIEHSIAYAKLSKYVKEIFVSSDSEHIKEIAYSNNVKYINRPQNLLGEAEVADIYADFIKKIDFDFKKKDGNETKICKVFDVLGFGQIEDYISDEDIDEEDLTSSNSTDNESISDNNSESSDSAYEKLKKKRIPPSLKKNK